MNLPKPRMTPTTVQVLQALAEQPGTERYGLEVMALTGLPSGTVFPILARLERVGWLDSGWEQVDPGAAGRPRRRYYRFTHGGRAETDEVLAQVARERRQRAARLRPAEGLT